MTMVSPDNELVAAYAAEGSESAFRALVARHVNLVYATALRQAGDAGMAEEITQNVFMALARKSPRLAGTETLAGWLHRTAILEAKARIRSELRRQRREEAAAELGALEHEGASPMAALTPLLDEGLLELRDGDRLALVLRFFEDRSLRDVGAALGVDEDAARKRVSRALDRLTEFFQRRGFALSAVGGGAALLTGSVQAAPAAVAVSAANAGLATGGASGGINLIWLQLMKITQTQAAVLCVLVAAAPLAWQTQAHAELGRQRTLVQSQTDELEGRAAALESEVRINRAALQRAQTDTVNAEVRLAGLKAQREGRAPRPKYQWDDSSPVMRVPKLLLQGMPISAVKNHRGILNQQMKEVLQMTDGEAEATQAAVDAFLNGFQTKQAGKVQAVAPTRQELQGRKPEEVRVFEVGDMTEEMKALRTALFADLNSALGAERAGHFREALGGWMPVDDHYRGLSTERAVFHKGHREAYLQPKPGDISINWSLHEKEVGYMSVPLPLDEVSPVFRAHVEDWIALAKSAAPKIEGGQP